MDHQKLVIFQLSLGEKWTQEMVDLGYLEEPSFRNTIKKLSEIATVRLAKDDKEAFDLLKENPTPRAIIITDSIFMEPENAKLTRQVADYARGGGTVILILGLPGESSSIHFQSFMKECGLPWTLSCYAHDDYAVNISAMGLPGVRWMYGLPALFNSDSMFLENVASNARWYLPAAPYTWNEEEQSMPPPPRKGTPVAFSKVGKGYLGYIGDINNEKATDAIILAMLGMNDPPQ
ncbi:hypothetical protein GGR54DRAFT_611409 [Hypoxylon sp. NC1633]|nr:hypothetical protein GGR54DRAFT_611409 [Hypoxylon sp. NC1633]